MVPLRGRVEGSEVEPGTRSNRLLSAGMSDQAFHRLRFSRCPLCLVDDNTAAPAGKHSHFEFPSRACCRHKKTASELDAVVFNKGLA